MYQIPLFLIPLITGGILQIIKIIIDYYKGEKLGFNRFFAAGGFPSVHSGLSTSLLVTIGYVYGINGPYFAIALIFSILFWYDAANIRYQAGKHAKVINKMKSQLSELFNPSIEPTFAETLKERLGHTFWEVIGGIFLSLTITYAIIYILSIYHINIIR